MLEIILPQIHRLLSHGKQRPYIEFHIFQKLPVLVCCGMVVQVDCVDVLSMNTLLSGPVTPSRQSYVKLAEGVTTALPQSLPGSLSYRSHLLSRAVSLSLHRGFLSWLEPSLLSIKHYTNMSLPTSDGAQGTSCLPEAAASNVTKI